MTIITDTSWADEMTVIEAADVVCELSQPGIICPCCNQLAKVYKRKLNHVMAHLLIQINAVTRDGQWVHISNLPAIPGRDTGKLQNFGLIETAQSDKADGNPSSGWWRITPRGKDFVDCLDVVPSYLLVYNGEIVGESPEQISIVDALGVHFNYDQLMKL